MAKFRVSASCALLHCLPAFHNTETMSARIFRRSLAIDAMEVTDGWLKARRPSSSTRQKKPSAHHQGGAWSPPWAPEVLVRSRAGRKRPLRMRGQPLTARCSAPMFARSLPNRLRAVGERGHMPG